MATKKAAARKRISPKKAVGKPAKQAAKLTKAAGKAKAPNPPTKAGRGKDAPIVPRPAPAKVRRDKKVAKTISAKPVPPQNTQAEVPRVEGGKWAPGASGNPGGRPRNKPLTDAFRAALERLVPGDAQGRTYGELIAEAAIFRAAKGSIEHLREIGDRVEGRATQRIETTGKDGGPIDIATLTPEQRDAEIAQLAADLGFTKAGR